MSRKRNLETAKGLSYFVIVEINLSLTFTLFSDGKYSRVNHSSIFSIFNLKRIDFYSFKMKKSACMIQFLVDIIGLRLMKSNPKHVKIMLIQRCY